MIEKILGVSLDLKNVDGLQSSLKILKQNSMNLLNLPTQHWMNLIFISP